MSPLACFGMSAKQPYSGVRVNDENRATVVFLRATTLLAASYAWLALRARGARARRESRGRARAAFPWDPPMANRPAGDRGRPAPPEEAPSNHSTGRAIPENRLPRHP